MFIRIMFFVKAYFIYELEGKIQHSAVNHLKNYIDLDNEVHTQKIKPLIQNKESGDFY